MMKTLFMLLGLFAFAVIFEEILDINEEID
jgi:hypothetical protein